MHLKNQVRIISRTSKFAISHQLKHQLLPGHKEPTNAPGGLSRLQGQDNSEGSFHSTRAHVNPIRGVIHRQYTCSPGHPPASGCGTDKMMQLHNFQGVGLNHHSFSYMQKSPLGCKWALGCPLQDNLNLALIDILIYTLFSSLTQVLT